MIPMDDSGGCTTVRVCYTPAFINNWKFKKKCIYVHVYTFVVLHFLS